MAGSEHNILDAERFEVKAGSLAVVVEGAKQPYMLYLAVSGDSELDGGGECALLDRSQVQALADVLALFLAADNAKHQRSI